MRWRAMLLLLAALLAGARGQGALPSLQALQGELQEALQEVPGAECRRQVAVVLDGLRNLSDWALQMLDATAKVPSGLLRGNLRALGDLDECVAVEAEAHNSLRGKYCLASFHVDADSAVVSHFLDIATGGRRHLEFRHRTLDVGDGELQRAVTFTPEFTRGELGVCVPHALAPADVEAALRALARRLRPHTALEADVRVTEHACRTRDGPARPPGAAHYALASFCGLLTIIIVSATIWDVYYVDAKTVNANTSHTVLRDFSLRTNWKRLTSERNEEIGCIDGVRVLCSAFALFLHHSLYMQIEPSMNKTTIAQMSQRIYYMPVCSGLIMNDPYLALGGLLLSYRMGGKIRSGSFKYTAELLNRFTRIAPVYYLVIWFYTTFLEYLGDGPSWETFIKYNVDVCRKNWIFNILYINNFINRTHICMLQSWFFSVNMQLFLLALLVLVPLYRWRKGRALVLALMALSVALHAATIISMRTPAVFGTRNTDMALYHMLFTVHFSPLVHLSPFLVGLYCGYILNKTENKKFSMNKVSVVVGWTACAIMMAYSIYGPYHMVLDSYEYNVWDAAVYSTLSRLFIGVAVSWLVFATHRGYGGWVNAFLSCYPFRVISRLMFCANLTHFILLLHNGGRRRVPLWMDFYSEVQIVIAEFVIITAFSAILYVCVESPINLITRRFLPTSSSKNTQQSKDNYSEKNN